MQAIQVSELGAASVLKIAQLPQKPSILPSQVLVRNAFAGVNFIDVYHRNGLYPLPLPFVPGREASGIVSSVGSDITHVKPGDRVSYFSPGSYAQYTAVEGKWCSVVPKGVSMEQAAIATVSGVTSLMLCQEIYKVKQGDVVLVHAAAGGIGQALCQICSSLGAVVIGVCSNETKAKIARDCGCKHVLTYDSGDVTAKVMEITGNAGCKTVFDGVGKNTFETSLSCTTTRGYIICFGNASGKPDAFDITRLTKGSKILCRPTMMDFIQTAQDFQRLMNQTYDMLAKGSLKFEINRVYDLADAAQAHSDLEGRGTTGKLVLCIPPE